MYLLPGNLEFAGSQKKIFGGTIGNSNKSYKIIGK
jgi:hypothetical protein